MALTLYKSVIPKEISSCWYPNPKIAGSAVLTFITVDLFIVFVAAAAAVLSLTTVYKTLHTLSFAGTAPPLISNDAVPAPENVVALTGTTAPVSSFVIT